MLELQEAREQIDKIDHELAALFEKRMQAAAGVAQFKIENELPVLDAAREQAVLDKNVAFIQNESLRPYYEEYMRHLMGISRQYQTAIIGKDLVCYQGTEGGFGHSTAKKLYPHSRLVSVATFAEVFQSVQQGEAAFGVVPFENSTTGDVADILDLCFKHPECSIVSMFDLSVTQNLLGLPGANLADIKEIYSHPQALEQSTRFLARINAKLEPFANTALAAKYVAQCKDKTKAAIASLEAGRLYGLVPIAQDISTENSNTTRFIIVSKEPSLQGDRFSLLVNVEHAVGSLAKVIATIAEHGFNMESIKSRPMPGRPWEYYFYLELLGTPTDQSGTQLVMALEENCQWVRSLGRYSRKSG